MSKETKLFFLGIIGITLALLGCGLYEKSKIEDGTLNDLNKNARNFSVTASDFKISNDFEEYIDKSDFIAKVKFSGENLITYGSVLYELDVLEVLKGQEREKIYFFDNVMVIGKDEGYVTLYDGSTPLKDGEEYLLFLKEKEFGKDNKFLKNQDSVYVLTNSLSKIPLKSNIDEFIVKNLSEERHTYDEYLRYEYVFPSEELKNSYLKIKKLAEEKYFK